MIVSMYVTHFYYPFLGINFSEKFVVFLYLKVFGYSTRLTIKPRETNFNFANYCLIHGKINNPLKRFNYIQISTDLIRKLRVELRLI